MVGLADDTVAFDGFRRARIPSRDMHNSGTDPNNSGEVALPSGAICYAFGGVFPLVYLLSIRREKQDRYLRFNCFQCLILLALLLPFTFVGFPAGWPEKLGSVGLLVWIIAFFAAMIQSARQKWLYLPAIGPLAKWLADR